MDKTKIIAKKIVDIDTKAINLKDGSISSLEENINITSGTLTLDKTKIIAKKIVDIDTKAINLKDGSISSLEDKINITSDTLVLSNTKIIAKKAIDINTDKLSLSNNSKISANDITIVSKSLSKEDKSFSLENSKLVAKNKLKITVQEDLIIDKSDIFNESYDLELNVKSLDNRSNISTNNNITINSQEGIINSQYISAPNKVELIAKGDILNNIELNSSIAHGIKGKTTYLSSLASYTVPLCQYQS